MPSRSSLITSILIPLVFVGFSVEGLREAKGIELMEWGGEVASRGDRNHGGIQSMGTREGIESRHREVLEALPKPDWLDAEHGVALYRGDSLRVLGSMPDGWADAVVTDPPYSSGGQFRGDRAQSTRDKYCHTNGAAVRLPDFTGDNRDQRSFLLWESLWLAEAFRVSRPGAVCCVFTDWRQLPVTTDAVQVGGWTWRNLCTWHKPGCRTQKGRFSASAEYVVYATKGPHSFDGAGNPPNVLRVPTLTGKRKEHIAEKPAAVMDWLCQAVSPGGIVLDPFFGSGATAEACIRSGRGFVGVEIADVWFDLAVSRIEAAIEQRRNEELSPEPVKKGKNR